MSHAISLKLNNDIFNEAEQVINNVKIPRNAFINEAIKYYTRAMKRKILKEQFFHDSKLVGKHSLEINREFSDIEDEIIGL